MIEGIREIINMCKEACGNDKVNVYLILLPVKYSALGRRGTTCIGFDISGLHTHVQKDSDIIRAKIGTVFSVSRNETKDIMC